MGPKLGKGESRGGDGGLGVVKSPERKVSCSSAENNEKFFYEA